MAGKAKHTRADGAGSSSTRAPSTEVRKALVKLIRKLGPHAYLTHKLLANPWRQALSEEQLFEWSPFAEDWGDCLEWQVNREWMAALLPLVAKQTKRGPDWVARHPGADAMLLSQLAAKAAPEELEWIACHEQCGPELLDQFARTKSAFLRRAVARHRNTSAATLTYLATSKGATLLSELARNPNTPEETLNRLNIGDSEVALELAARSSLPPQRAKDLVSKGCAAAVIAVAEHPECPPDLLQEFTSSSDWMVREGAARNRSLPHELQLRLMVDKDQRVRCGLASNPCLRGDVLMRLARDRRNDVRQALACNPELPEDVLQQLLKDQDEEVLWGLATQPAMTEPMQLKLAGCGSIRSMGRLAMREGLPTSVAQVLGQCLFGDVRTLLADNSSVTDTAILKDLAALAAESVRLALARRADLPQDVQMQLADDKWECVRAELAENEGLCLPAQQKLALDRSAKVRKAAQTALACFPLEDRARRDAAVSDPVTHLKRALLDEDRVLATYCVRGHQIDSAALDQALQLGSWLLAPYVYSAPTATEPQLLRWAVDQAVSPWIRLWCLANPALSSAKREELTQALTTELQRPALREPSASTYEEQAVRGAFEALGLLARPADQGFIERALGSKSWLERAALHWLQDLDPSVRSQLSSDPDPRVQGAFE